MMQNTERKGTAFYDERKIRVVVCSSVKGHCKGAGAEKYFYTEKKAAVSQMNTTGKTALAPKKNGKR